VLSFPVSPLKTALVEGGVSVAFKGFTLKQKTAKEKNATKDAGATVNSRNNS
jgi:hypothetical protein